MSDADLELYRFDSAPTDRAERRAKFIAAAIGEHLGELLDENEVGSLLEALMTARALTGDGTSDTEYQLLLRWAERTKIDDLMIRAICERETAVEIDDLDGVQLTAAVPDELWAKYASVAYGAADEINLTPSDGGPERLVLEAFLINRLAQRRTVNRSEMARLVDWARAAAANLDLLDLIVKHPNTTVRMTPNGSALVGVSTLLDEPSAEVA